MKNMRILSAVSALIMACPLVMGGCGSEEKTSSESKNSTSSESMEINSESEKKPIEESENSFNGLEEPIENLKKAYENCDAEAYIDMHPDEYIDVYLEKNGVTRESFNDEMSKNFEMIKESLGDNLEMSYEIISQTQYVGEELEKFKTDTEEICGIKLDIEDAYRIIVDMKLKGDNDVQEIEKHMNIFKIDGEWKTIDFS